MMVDDGSWNRVRPKVANLYLRYLAYKNAGHWGAESTGKRDEATEKL